MKLTEKESRKLMEEPLIEMQELRKQVRVLTEENESLNGICDRNDSELIDQERTIKHLKDLLKNSEVTLQQKDRLIDQLLSFFSITEGT